ncbi:spore maturation protein CgeB [Paenibacillus sp. yr247]|uniref:CgeB family protein n=1 Tax=Paenibacillus sp. yr247 TaxID=1761880 RepID=UPI00088BB894|nr:glycosyltransferase [Paenibacillus sp. yr247]SDN59027.1 spore maturation protein CgeB [Paenibacillus sp. yr247]
MLGSRNGWNRGLREGYDSGWRHGYHLGRCEAIVKRIPEIGSRRDIKVMYVESGLWSYRPMDQGIIAELKALCAEVLIVTPEGGVLDAANAFRPDLLLSLNSAELLKVQVVDAVRALGIKTAVWFTDDPYYTDVTIDIATHYDVVFTLEQSCVPLYRKAGCEQVHHLPFGVNRSIFHPKAVSSNYRVDICFIGVAFWNRVAFFDQIAHELSSKKLLIAGYWWDRLKGYTVLESKIKSGYWVSPEESASYYNGAKIVINMHRAIDDASNQNSKCIPANSINPRSFEISACGQLQLTDSRANLSSMYVPQEEVVTYDSPQNLLAKIDYYLEHEAERQQIALRGLIRTMREHTYRNRILQMFELIFG